LYIVFNSITQLAFNITQLAFNIQAPFIRAPRA